MKSATRKGQIIDWKDDRGFGFIKPEDGGQEVFLHITAFKQRSRRPKQGDVVSYELMVSKADGRVRAANACLEGAISKSASNPVSLGLEVLLLALLPVWGAIDCALETANFLPLIIYPIMSGLTFILYADDKARAVQKRWRISESTLHFCELAGGWLGAFIAQRRIHHKSSKASYQFVFWVIVAAHLLFWVSWLFFVS